MSVPKLFNVVGARPQIIKSSAISRVLANNYKDQVREVMVHTGQHYDRNMSEVFFEEMGIPRPHFHLHTGPGTHGKQTAVMLQGLESLMVKEKPGLVVVYGDTNTTLAAALAASKLKIPLAHVEAGLRSFNKQMPEEINRIVCDHVSSLLFTPTRQGLLNLEREGLMPGAETPHTADRPGVYHCGDVMFDNAVFFAEMAEKKTALPASMKLEKERYVLVTLHRDHNTDNPARLKAILQTIIDIATEEKIQVVLPLHPRTRKMILEAGLDRGLKTARAVLTIPPASFLEMIALEKNAALIMTDSGGVQKEAHFFKKPCVIFRRETEWTELVENGTARLADADPRKIRDSFMYFRTGSGFTYPDFYGDGNAAGFICSAIHRFLSRG